MILSRSETKQFYDRFGSKQDSQSFYEDRALDELIAHADFAHARKLFELGCGTGRFALRLLSSELPADTTYLGMDLSDTMVALALQRLAPYANRARIIHSDGEMQFPLNDQSVDRVIVTYVFDLLADADIEHAIREARRVLSPGGKLCLVSLSQGVNFASRVVCRVWSALFRARAALVGGCRPIRLLPFIESDIWTVEYHQVLTQFAVPSEVLIASPNPE
jgi:ubiquinone/menaquinone biosynthesis C-methylase UbiE